ncbi:hypothetical protein AK88_03238 [Plasmodium fragile]|uniref:Uncharacterized protein n=1 Tax=Plasmodium fragile TaxID=5857 RepID=A0A0D9QJ59_PLAFR|nr:uncharacterized protein AK88_03238 [Plasmodium fragile]KJP87070.1 hypothetical protein AK88_03238 [Plasmodium fragile]
MEGVDELDAIKNYLTELNRSAQSLQNTNYHRSVLKASSRKDQHEKNPFLRSIQMNKDVENQFRCIDLVSHSNDSQSVSTSDDLSEGDRRSRRGSTTRRALQVEQRRKKKTTSLPKGGGEKKDIRFSLENRSSVQERNKCGESNTCVASLYRQGDTQTRLVPCGAAKKREEGEYSKMGSSALRGGHNEIGKPPLCTDQRKEIKEGQTKQTEQVKQTQHTPNFSNERERELFQYLIVKANDEIENISLSLGKKYEEELMNKVNSIKGSYENKIKKLSNARKCLCDEKEKMVKEDKNNKEVIKKLEKKNILLLHQMEQLKKKFHLVCDATVQKGMPKWNTDKVGMGTMRDGLCREGPLVKDYEKKISKLNEQLNRTHGECLTFKTMWSNLQREVRGCLTAKKEVEEKWAHLKGENFKMEAENDRLRAELRKAKLSVRQFKEDHADECQKKDHLLACHKTEEKKLKEDLQSYKMKCALLENRNQEQLFEKKCKMLENALKDAENEKSLCDRICEKNENIQRDMRIEIKTLKNELYECRNKAYKISKSGLHIPEGGIFYGDWNGMEAKGKQDTTQKIKSVQKQLTLLKLERSNKEAELKRCPQHGGRTEEVRRRECLSTRLQCIDDKIKMLDGTLKKIQMSIGDHVT